MRAIVATIDHYGGDSFRAHARPLAVAFGRSRAEALSALKDRLSTIPGAVGASLVWEGNPLGKIEPPADTKKDPQAQTLNMFGGLT